VLVPLLQSSFQLCEQLALAVIHPARSIHRKPLREQRKLLCSFQFRCATLSAGETTGQWKRYRCLCGWQHPQIGFSR
jgi:hypothetical protein